MTVIILRTQALMTARGVSLIDSVLRCVWVFGISTLHARPVARTSSYCSLIMPKRLYS